MKYVKQITSPYDAYLFKKHMQTHRNAIKNVQPKIDSKAPFCHAATENSRKSRTRKPKININTHRKRVRSQSSHVIKRSLLPQRRKHFKRQSKSLDMPSTNRIHATRFNPCKASCLKSERQNKDYTKKSKQKHLAKQNEMLVDNILKTRPMIDTSEPPKLLEPINYAYRKHRAKTIEKQNLKIHHCLVSVKSTVPTLRDAEKRKEEAKVLMKRFHRPSQIEMVNRLKNRKRKFSNGEKLVRSRQSQSHDFLKSRIHANKKHMVSNEEPNWNTRISKTNVFNSKLKLDFQSFMCEMEKISDIQGEFESSTSISERQSFLPQLKNNRTSEEAKSEE